MIGKESSQRFQIKLQSFFLIGFWAAHNTLNQHLYEIEQEATKQIELILSRLVKERGITEELKAADPLRWVQEMNNAKHCAEEIVLKMLICR